MLWAARIFVHNLALFGPLSDRPINILAPAHEWQRSLLYCFIFWCFGPSVKCINAQKCVSGKNAREWTLCANTSQIMRAAVVSNVRTYFAKAKNKYESVEELINRGADAHLPRRDIFNAYFSSKQKIGCASMKENWPSEWKLYIHILTSKPGFFSAGSFYRPESNNLRLVEPARCIFLRSSLLSKYTSSIYRLFAACTISFVFSVCCTCHAEKFNAVSRVADARRAVCGSTHGADRCCVENAFFSLSSSRIRRRFPAWRLKTPLTEVARRQRITENKGKLAASHLTERDTKVNAR